MLPSLIPNHFTVVQRLLSRFVSAAVTPSVSPPVFVTGDNLPRGGLKIPSDTIAHSENKWPRTSTGRPCAGTRGYLGTARSASTALSPAVRATPPRGRARGARGARRSIVAALIGARRKRNATPAARQSAGRPATRFRDGYAPALAGRPYNKL